ANRPILSAFGAAQQGALPVRRITTGIATIRRQAYCVRVLGKRKADKCDDHEHGIVNIRFYFHVFFCFISIWTNSEPKVSINGCSGLFATLAYSLQAVRSPFGFSRPALSNAP